MQEAAPAKKLLPGSARLGPADLGRLASAVWPSSACALGPGWAVDQR